MNTASIVIITLNRYEHLKKLLQSICYLDYDNFEVVVVNGPSTDGTADLLTHWSDKIKSGVCPEANVSMSRNIGIAMASGEFVAFIDDDAIPEPEWLNQAMEAFERESIAGVGGPVYDHTGYSFQSIYVSTDRLGWAHLSESEPCPYNCYPGSYNFPHLAGGNAVFRRKALLEIGGFDEEFEYHLDETDVCLRLVDAGYELLQLSNSFVHHKYAPSYMREHSIPKYRYPTLKSKAYYANRHGGPYWDQEEIDGDYNFYADVHRQDIMQGIRNKLLGEDDLVNFERHKETAMIQGKRAANCRQKLMDPVGLDKYASSFRPFRPIRCEGAPLRIVFLGDVWVLNGDHEGEWTIQNLAIDLAGLGHKIHIIVPGHDYNTVDFDAGVWIHRIIVAESEGSTCENKYGISDPIWKLSVAIVHEVDRIADHHGVDLVHASVSNMAVLAMSRHAAYKTAIHISSGDLTEIEGDLAANEVRGKLADEQESGNAVKRIINNSAVITMDSLEAIRQIEELSGIDETTCSYIGPEVNTSEVIELFREVVGQEQVVNNATQNSE